MEGPHPRRPKNHLRGRKTRGISKFPNPLGSQEAYQIRKEQEDQSERMLCLEEPSPIATAHLKRGTFVVSVVVSLTPSAYYKK
jgi:hypothetical protein